ncbi:MAG: MFS transporter, partial [Methylophilales bacterium]|nr:MFS transporter [Methylophilales bacterium]
MKTIFRALAGRDFRLFFFGQLTSFTGTWVQEVALGWITYRVTGSPFMLALVAFSSQIPMLLTTPLGGMLADHFSRRNIMLCTHTVEMLLAATMAWLTWHNAVTVPILITAATILGLSGAIDMTARQAMVSELVSDKKLLSNA